MDQPESPSAVVQYQRLLARSRRTVFWALDDSEAPWELEPGGEPPGSGDSWFFLVNFPRTGSTAAAEILNLHPDVYCGNEHHVLPLLMTILHSPLLMAPDLWTSVRYTKQVPVTAGNVRALMDGWRTCVSTKPIFGDKGEMYHQHFGASCREVFPGCKFVLAVRHPLDTLSSYIRQPWAVYLRRGDGQHGFFSALQQRAREMLVGNTTWREHAAVVEFEQLASEAGFRATIARVLTHLGADPAEYDWDAGWANCRHSERLGTWVHDEEVRRFMEWLETRDAPLHSALAGGSYYLDDDGDEVAP